MRTIQVEQDFDMILSIKQFGYEGNGKEARWGPWQRDNYLLHYIVTGKGYYNGYPIGENQSFLIRPNTQHEYIFDTLNPWNYYWMIFDGTSVEGHLKELCFDEITGVSTNLAHSKIISFFEYIFHTNGNIVPVDFAKGCFSILMSYHDKQNRPMDRDAGNITRLHVERAVEYCILNYCHPISISDISEFVHLDNQYLYNIFKKHLHVSPKAYLNNIRVTKAKEMLIHNSLTIAEIANSVGYEDSFQFSKFFKKKTGVSPNIYRKEKQK